jgi:hypothetical protein
MKKILWIQFTILLGGTLFAWYNFTRELIDWLASRPCTVGCPAFAAANPFLTPCFYGAVFFAIALALNIWALRKI